MSLTDAQWARIEPLLPDRTAERGGRWRDHRQVIDVIAFQGMWTPHGLQWHACGTTPDTAKGRPGREPLLSRPFAPCPRQDSNLRHPL
ncbi:transposase [Streptomyces sp. enrichment culture]|uniref:transposase n=1 Tax=Streptomyces sp. enrichment culture TaxID=1795815 RepID=UPI003F54FF3C